MGSTVREIGVVGEGRLLGVVGEGEVKRTRCRTRFGFWVEWRTRRIERVAGGVVESESEFVFSRRVMVPSSEGWPPP